MSAFLIRFWEGGENANKKGVDLHRSHAFVELRCLLSVPVSGQEFIFLLDELTNSQLTEKLLSFLNLAIIRKYVVQCDFLNKFSPNKKLK